MSNPLRPSSLAPLAPLVMSALLPACGGPEELPNEAQVLEIAPDESGLTVTAVRPVFAPATPAPWGLLAPPNAFTFQLTGTDTCSLTHEIAPAPGESGHWLAVRLTPPKYPATLHDVGYALTNHAPKPSAPWTCSTNIAHTVKVWKQASATPAATPPAGALTIPVAARNVADAVVQYALATPGNLTLNAGESLFIAVRSGGNVPNTTCFAACGNVTAPAGREFWSFATGAPFAWEDLASYGILAVPFRARAL